MEKTQQLTKQQIKQLMSQSPNLKFQAYEDIPTLHPLSPQVISRQATLNIGTIGHVAHGKSTVVRAISGVQTVKFRQERIRNITIRLGYANAKIYKCPTCKPPECFKCHESSKEDNPKCDNMKPNEKQKCNATLELMRHVSFCDCPGHDVYLSRMLTGAAVMDGALLLVAANMECPQPQTAEHLMALEIMKLDHMIILQNKIDIVFKDREKTLENYKQIKQFMKDTRCKNAPIIPISAEQRYNIDAVCQSICNIPIPKRNLTIPPKMIIIRSFDVNKPGTEIDNLVGGVVGGSLLEGVLKIGMEVEIRPGHLYKDKEGNTKCQPIRSRIVTLEAEKNQLLYAVPGGLIGVGLLLDPSLTRNDRMVGNVLGEHGQMPQIFIQIDVQYSLMRKLLGGKKSGQNKQTKVQKITEEEVLKLNVGSTQTPGRITKVYDDMMKIKLNSPVCTKIGQKVAFSRKIENSYRLIGHGIIKTAKSIVL